MRNKKSPIPNPQSPIPTRCAGNPKHQIPKSKSLEFGIWNLEFPRRGFGALYPDPIVRAASLGLVTLGVLLIIGHVSAGVIHKIYSTEVTDILRDFFGLEREGSVATWFSSLQLALIAVSCGVIFVSEKVSGSTARYRLGWLGFLLLFLFLSLDETAQVHERMDRIVEALRKPAGGAALAHPGLQAGMDGAADYLYLLVYVPVLAGVSLVLSRFFSRRVRDRGTRFLLLAGLLGFVVKLGLEPVEAWAGERTWMGHRLMFEVVILQMYGLILGETLILTAFLNYLAGLIKPYRHPALLRSRSMGY
jgi:hypothetical protein